MEEGNRKEWKMQVREKGKVKGRGQPGRHPPNPSPSRWGVPLGSQRSPPGCPQRDPRAQLPAPGGAGRTPAQACRAAAPHLAPLTRWQLAGERLRLPPPAPEQKMRVTPAGWGFYSPDKNSAGWPAVGGPERCE